MIWNRILYFFREILIKTFFFIIIGLFWGSFYYVIVNMTSFHNFGYWIIIIIVGAFGIAFTGKILDIISDIE